MVKVPIVDLQKKYDGRVFNMRIDNNGSQPVKVRLLGDGSMFVKAVGANGGDTPTPGPGGQGLTPEERNAIVELFRMATYTGDNAGQYIAVLDSQPATGITATFTQGGATIYDTASLESLRQYLVVEANYSGSSSVVVSDYTLSGTLTPGTSTVTVSWGGFTDTFSVTVTAATVLTGITATFTQGQTVCYADMPLDKLKKNLVVEAQYDSGSPVTISDYTLSGSLVEGLSTVTVAYQDKTDTFDVTVSAAPLLYVDGSYIDNGVGLSSQPPYYNQSNNRNSYKAFDLRLSGGVSYEAYFNYDNNSEKVPRVGFQFYNQIALDRVLAGQPFSWSQDQYDHGWESLPVSDMGTVRLTCPASVSGSPIVGVRITISYADDSSDVENDLSINYIGVNQVTI